MLGWADAGYNLLIGNPIYITYLLFVSTTSCVAIGAESERFIFHPAQH